MVKCFDVVDVMIEVCEERLAGKELTRNAEAYDHAKYACEQIDNYSNAIGCEQYDIEIDDSTGDIIVAVEGRNTFTSIDDSHLADAVVESKKAVIEHVGDGVSVTFTIDSVWET